MTNNTTQFSISGGKYLFGFVDDERYLVSNTVEQICAFIMNHQFQNVRIVTFLDELEIETQMGFIHYCRNQQFLQKALLPILVPMQQGEVDIPEFIPYVDEKYVIKNVRFETEEGHFLADVDFLEGYPDVKKKSDFFENEEKLLKAYPNSMSKEESYHLALEREIL